MQRQPLAVRMRKLGLAFAKDAKFNQLLISAFEHLEDALVVLSDARASFDSGTLPSIYRALLVELLRRWVRSLAESFGAAESLQNGRLFGELAGDARAGALLAQAWPLSSSWPCLEPEQLGQIYEVLLGLQLTQTVDGRLVFSTHQGRNNSGVFFTPSALADSVVRRALELLPERDPSSLRICDPALGGAMFLLQAARQLHALANRESDGVARGISRSQIIVECLFGVDQSELSVAVAEAALWLWAADSTLAMRTAGQHLMVGDALLGQGWLPSKSTVPKPEKAFNWGEALPALKANGFDCVVGNPPWVAFAGRAAKPLLPPVRAWLSKNYRAFRGYPTLQAMFVERAAELAPHGVVALLLPSSLADLEGYRSMRQVFTASHTLISPLTEYGEDAFCGVTQPCFALVACPSEPPSVGSSEAWVLSERQSARLKAAAIEVPPALLRLRGVPAWPASLFREMGFQTTRRASENLLVRKPAELTSDLCPILEGKDVHEFREGEARLYLRMSPELLAWAGCRLRAREQFAAVDFVVRQTAKVPIAARHTSGLPFRNSLLGGFEAEGLSTHLVLGLLNSALYRALHLAFQRDARQAAFPQVKVAHLRCLPMPPLTAALVQRIDALARAAESVTGKLDRTALDECVFELFAISFEERTGILRFLSERVPELGYASEP